MLLSVYARITIPAASSFTAAAKILALKYAAHLIVAYGPFSCRTRRAVYITREQALVGLEHCLRLSGCAHPRIQQEFVRPVDRLSPIAGAILISLVAGLDAVSNTWCWQDS